MEGSAERAFLEQLEERLSSGEPVEAEVSLMLLAGQAVPVDEDELRGALRRSVELLAVGGDPRRDLDPQGRAVTALAEDLDEPGRRAALADGIASIRAAGERTFPSSRGAWTRSPPTTLSRGAGSPARC